MIRGIACGLFLMLAAPSFALNSDEHNVLVIVLDGLRPDYVTAERMPNLHALSERGVVGLKHHAVFPTVTRVNSATFATGCYPKNHGVLANSIFIPEVSETRGINTADAKNLFEVDEKTGGKLITARTTGEIIQSAGGRVLVVSSGSSGSAFLLNPRIAGGVTINTDLTLPAKWQETVDHVLGPKPDERIPNRMRNRRAVDAYLLIGLDEVKPVLTYMWLSDPDKTGHAKGIGSPEFEEAVRAIDSEIGRILVEHERRGMTDRVDIMVTSDHGFSTHIGGANVAGTLVRAGVKRSMSSTDLIVVQGAIYVDQNDPDVIQRAVTALQQDEGIGAIFTTGGNVPGTLSIESMHWNHARASAIYVTGDWDHGTNEFGWKGRTTLGGVAGHGTSSPYDIHNTLIAAGPSFKSGIKSELPTGNVDIAPTALALLGVEHDSEMDGRILTELIKDGSDSNTIDVSTSVTNVVADWDGGSYQLELSETAVGDYKYLDWTRVKRTTSVVE